MVPRNRHACLAAHSYALAQQAGKNHKHENESENDTERQEGQEQDQQQQRQRQQEIRIRAATIPAGTTSTTTNNKIRFFHVAAEDEESKNTSSYSSSRRRARFPETVLQYNHLPISEPCRHLKPVGPRPCLQTPDYRPTKNPKKLHTYKLFTYVVYLYSSTPGIMYACTHVRKTRLSLNQTSSAVSDQLNPFSTSVPFREHST